MGPYIPTKGWVHHRSAPCVAPARHPLGDAPHWPLQTSRSPSIEAPHNSIHGMVGGLMGTFQSAFHPIFWLHHCNVDRILEKYLEVRDSPYASGE